MTKTETGGAFPAWQTDPNEMRGWATLTNGTRRPLSREEIENLMTGIKTKQAEMERAMPNERAALAAMSDAYSRLEQFGWRSAIYCPKDGTVFDAIECGSTGIHDCYYEGQWPDGHWWILAEGDIWPSRPVLFRLKNALPPAPKGAGDVG